MTESRGKYPRTRQWIGTAGWGVLAAMFLVPMTPLLCGGWGRRGLLELGAAYVLAFVYASPVWLVVGALGGAFIGWRMRRASRVFWLEIGIAGAAAGSTVYAVFGDLTFALGECCVPPRVGLLASAGAGGFYALGMLAFVRRMVARTN